MNEQVKRSVLRVLRRSVDGFALVTWHCSVSTGLSWWQRLVNWAVRKIGADNRPFTDPLNWMKCEVRPLSEVADPEHVNQAMMELSDTPKCRICGSLDLQADPAGYYCHAEDWNGAPLLCMKMENH